MCHQHTHTKRNIKESPSSEGKWSQLESWQCRKGWKIMEQVTTWVSLYEYWNFKTVKTALGAFK